MTVNGTPLYGREFLAATEDELKIMIRLLDKNNYTDKTLVVYTEWVRGEFKFKASAQTIIDDMGRSVGRKVEQ